MSVAMPPQHVVEYRVEAPQRGGDDMVAQAARFLGAQRAAAAAKAPSVEQRSASATSLPPLDLGSKALSQQDRQGLAAASSFSFAGDLSTIPASHGYVGQRIALAVEMQRLEGRMESGRTPSEQEARNFRCSIVDIAMDKRAGAYIQGGEKAAAAMRASIPSADVENCKPSSLREQMAGLRTQGAAVCVDPRAGAVKTAALVHVDPVARQVRPVHVDPVARQVRPVHVDPIARQNRPVNIDPVLGRGAGGVVASGGLRAQAEAQKVALGVSGSKGAQVDLQSPKRVHVELKGRSDPVHVDLVAYAASKGRGMAG